MARYKVWQTIVSFIADIVISVTTAAISTSLPDMEVWTSSNTAEMSTLFFWIGLAYIIGPLTVSSLFDRFNGMFLVFICFTVMAVALALAPTGHSLLVFQTLITVRSAFDNAVFSGCTTIVKDLWRNTPWMRPVILADSFMSMIGLAIGPLIASPFLGYVMDDSPSNETTTVNVTSLLSLDPILTLHGTLAPIQTLYLLMGAMNLAVAIICLITCCIASGDDEDSYSDLGSKSSEVSSQNSMDDNNELSTSGQIYSLLTIVVTLLLFTAICAFEVLLIYMLFTYLYEYLGFSTDAAALMASMLFGVRFAAQAIVVVLSRWVSSIYIVIFDMFTMFISSLLMLLAFIASEISTLTAVGIVVAGLGSSKFAASITLLTENVDLSAPMMAAIYSTVGVAILTVVPLSGSLLYYVGAVSFPLLMLAISVIALILLPINLSIMRSWR